MPERFSIVKKGYNPVEVDERLSALEEEVRAYREKDDAIRNAIVNAQIAADSIIQNAKNQGRTIRENTAKQLQDVSSSIVTQKRMLADFARDYNEMVSKYLTVTKNEDFKMISKKIDALEEYLKIYSEEVTEDLEIEKKGAGKKK